MRTQDGGKAIREISLTVRHAGTTTMVRRIPGALAGYTDNSLELTLRNVWGDAAPEALVDIASCVNRCGEQLYVALRPGRNWRMLIHDFGGFWPGAHAAWSGQWHQGRFEFLSYDLRFFCHFTSCAGTWGPPQVWAIDKSGRGFMDVTRTRRDLVGSDARRYWQEYVSVRRRGRHAYGYDVYGSLAPWCADQYLLGDGPHCDAILEQQLARGYLGNNPGVSGPAFIRKLHKELVAWGYARR
jgi:hypothetical protein